MLITSGDRCFYTERRAEVPVTAQSDNDVHPSLQTKFKQSQSELFNFEHLKNETVDHVLKK